MICLENDALRVELYPEHGFVIGAIIERTSNANILWNPPNASFQSLPMDLGASGTASIDRFDRDILAGGWFTMIPNAGLPGSNEGLWMHGQAARLPWTVIEHNVDSCRCQIVLPQLELTVERSVRLAGASVHTQTIVHNQGAQTAVLVPGEHPCFPRALFAGGRILGLGGARVSVPSLAQPNAASFKAGTEFSWPDEAVIPLQATGTHDHLMLENRASGLAITIPRINRTLHLTSNVHVFPQMLFWSHYLPPQSPWPGDVFAWEPVAAGGRSYDEVHEKDKKYVHTGETLSWSMTLALT